MEVYGVLIFCFIMLFIVLYNIYYQKKYYPIRPSFVHRADKPQRRRKNSGGFYPIGYDGDYEDGEILVDYDIWSVEKVEYDDLGNIIEPVRDSVGWDESEWDTSTNWDSNDKKTDI